MVDFYVLEIQLGHITIDQVNKFWRSKVQARLRELGLDDSGRPLPTDTDDEGQAM